MTTWSILVITASLITADTGAEKPTGASRPSPQFATRLVARPISEILQTSYSEGTACVAPESCVPPAARGCAAPAACAPACAVPTCASPAPAMGGACYQPMDCNQVVGCGSYDGCPCGCGMGSACECCESPSCCRRCCNRCRWSRIHTTGDMYPHFAYYPQDHGYYYFRPYNYMHVYEHRARVVSLGGDPRNPYSVAMFDPIYEEFEQNVPPIEVPLPGSVQPLGSQLPNLEDLLNP